jgi:hypothetical protein
MPDYLHLSPKGYEIWAASLDRPLKRALGQLGQRNNARNNTARQPSVAASALSGDWIATLPGPNNEPVEIPFSVKVNGADITGVFHGENQELQIEKGKLDGNNFTWTLQRKRPEGGTMTYQMSGKLEDAKIAGKASTTLEGSEVKIDWTAKKKQ